MPYAARRGVIANESHLPTSEDPVPTDPSDHPVHQPLVDDFGQRLGRIGAALDASIASDAGDAVRRRTQWTDALMRDLPERGIGADAVLTELAVVVVPNGEQLMSPAFWGWITNGPTTVPLVAATAASVAAPQRYGIQAFNLLEELSLDWLADLCGLGRHMKGVYSSGGSVANLVALGAARQWAFEQRGIDPANDGLGGVSAAIYASAETHHTVQRSAGVLGIGRANVRHIGTDDHVRMRPHLLARAIEEDLAAGVLPVAVVATTGTTNTGSIDPLRELGEIARRYGVWFHVDGAYGLPGILDERVAPLYDGLELADSAIVDPHKWLGAPVGVAATFVRDRAILHRAFTQEPAAYLETGSGDGREPESTFDDMGVPYADYGVELSAPSRGVVVWSILRELGREGVAARIRQDDDHARHVADLVRAHPRLELLLDPVLSICCFRYVPQPPGSTADGTTTDGTTERHDVDALNAEILRRLHRDTAFVPSSTRVHGAYALRPCFINARTTTALVDAFVATVVELGDHLTTTS